jgi:hypothetical protein
MFHRRRTIIPSTEEKGFEAVVSHPKKTKRIVHSWVHRWEEEETMEKSASSSFSYLSSFKNFL